MTLTELIKPATMTPLQQTYADEWITARWCVRCTTLFVLEPKTKGAIADALCSASPRPQGDTEVTAGERDAS